MLALCLMLLETEEDRALIQQLYSRYERKLYAVALHILRDPHAAEDMVSAAFLSISEHLDRYKKIFQNSCQETESLCVTMQLSSPGGRGGIRAPTGAGRGAKYPL